MIAADLGDDDAAAIHNERGWERARALDQVALTGWSLIALWYEALQKGDVPKALEWQAQYLALVAGTENRVVKLVGLARAAEVSVAAGRHEEAERVANDAIAMAELGKAPHHHAMARSALGRVALARGDLDAAARAQDEAIATLATTGSGLELARVRMHRAAVHLEAGERDAARVEVTRAREAFVELGAVRDAARAEALLAKLG